MKKSHSLFPAGVFGPWDRPNWISIFFFYNPFSIFDIKLIVWKKVTRKAERKIVITIFDIVIHYNHDIINLQLYLFLILGIFLG